MVPYKCQLVVAGDLNINVDDPHDDNKSCLLELLTSFECTQWVTGTSLITWTLPFAVQYPISEHRTVQGWKRVNINLLRQSIRDSELCADIPESATTESVFEIYKNVLREVANEFAPAQTTEFRRQPIAVWFDDESRLLHWQSQLLECRYRRSGFVSNRLLWIQREWLLVGHISEHSGQSCKLWRAFSSIMGLDRVVVSKRGSIRTMSSGLFRSED